MVPLSLAPVCALQGLHYLYPTCEGADPEPQCLKERRTSGYLRLLITVALPYFLMSLLLFLIISAVRCHQRQQLQEPYMMNICVRVVRQAGSQGGSQVAR